MQLEFKTLFLVTMHVEILLGLLLLLAWTQNFARRELAWWAGAHHLRAVSIMLFGMPGAVPAWISFDLANAALFSSFALTWCGARAFNQRAPRPIWALVGVAVWLVAWRLPSFATFADLRATLGPGIAAAYTWLAAYELWRGRAHETAARWPAIAMLSAHGALFVLRTPIALLLALPADHRLTMSGWYELLSLEALLFTIAIAFILLAMTKESSGLSHRMAAITDPLTGILNRRGFLEQIQVLRSNASRGSGLALLLMDLDRFKPVNDRFGHDTGDRVLQTFAEIARSQIGPSDLICRWGGDEFAAMLSDATSARAMATAERIRATFQTAAVDQHDLPIDITVSIGVAFGSGAKFDVPKLLASADEALYRVKAAKRARGNAGETPTTAPLEPTPAAAAA